MSPYVSNKFGASIFMVDINSHKNCKIIGNMTVRIGAPVFLKVSNSVSFLFSLPFLSVPLFQPYTPIRTTSTLKMEATIFVETSVNIFHTIRRRLVAVAVKILTRIC